ncbi:hypothetical protein [Nostocoides vanveenii]|uniref:Uncharacterized protein n=1 Tax=Nostocoides vanveenii TaxID=330835 RepID=A0ABN2KE79_9MICO
MTTFDEGQHPRGTGGKFAAKQHAEPAELETTQSFPTYSRAEDTTDDLGGPDLGLLHPAPRASIFAGANPNRQSVGLPGHCESCAQHGHVAAHPDFGCGDVGCDLDHDEYVPEVSSFDDARIDALMAEADQAFEQQQAASRRMTTRSVQATAVMVRSIYPDAAEFTLEPDDEGGWSVTAGDHDFADHGDEVWNTTRLIGFRYDDFTDLFGVDVDDHRGRVESVSVNIDKVIART